MIDCETVREQLVLYAERELDPEETREIESHLQGCGECSREAGKIDHLRTWLADPDLFAPTEDAAWTSLPSACVRKVDSERMRRFPTVRRSLLWALPAAAGLFIMVGLFRMVRNPAPGPEIAESRPAPGNEAFLNRIQSVVTVDSTAQYLTECQDLLVDMLRAEQSCSGKRYDVSFQTQRARDLLGQKRILDSELNTPKVAQAKDLCDDLENVLVDLSLSQNCEAPDRFHSMRQIIEREKLLLRIKLVQSEIS
jgi:hypothetical protein